MQAETFSADVIEAAANNNPMDAALIRLMIKHGWIEVRSSNRTKEGERAHTHSPKNMLKQNTTTTDVCGGA